MIVGLVGSIDNDMSGTDMTIGADTALHRIVEAVDAIGSTAASHQRSFVIEVMGRRSGYLALMASLATGASWCLIPESPPDVDNWQAKMCEVLAAGRRAGRRQSIVILAEGATDRQGHEITADDVKRAIEEYLHEDSARHRAGPCPARRIAQRLRPQPEHAVGCGGRQARCWTRMPMRLRT